MGRRDLRESGPGARQGSTARGDRSAQGRYEGGFGPEVRLPRVDRVVVRYLPGSQGPRDRSSPTPRRRRQPSDLGCGPTGMAGVGRATVLEPQDEERARPAAEA